MTHPYDGGWTIAALLKSLLMPLRKLATRQLFAAHIHIKWQQGFLMRQVQIEMNLNSAQKKKAKYSALSLCDIVYTIYTK